LDLEITHKMLVREAMSSPVIAIDENSNMVEVAGMMRDHKVGAIIVTGNDDKPVGIVTERDVVVRVVSSGAIPREIQVKEVMTSPLRMVKPETSLIDAMSIMGRLNIRRLGVSYKGRLEGVISDKDILRMVPTMIEIVQERSRIRRGDSLSGPSVVGYCDSCGIYTTNLRSMDGEFLCEDCRVEIKV
jgi:signal-transduction protein with cAMP-binding, CBS, and nucleotidyltransferase domain